MDFKARLLRFYEAQCPSKCGDVEKLAVKYKTKEKDLFRQLTFKYGPEPKLSNADKAAIQKRTAKPEKKLDNLNKTNTLDTEEWMMSLLNQNDLELLKEIDNHTGKKLPQYILDKI